MNLFSVLALSLSSISLPALADGEGTYQVVYKGMSVCDDHPDCGNPGKRSCKVTLDFVDRQLKVIDVFGIGHSSTPDTGYFAVSNNPASLNGAELTIVTDEVEVDGGSLSAKLVAKGLRGNIYSQNFSIEASGYTPDSIDSITGWFSVKIGWVRGLWTNVRCANLQRVIP